MGTSYGSIPPFGIDLFVDDSDGVMLEGEMHGFGVIVVDPGDPCWASKVKAACRVSPDGSGKPKPLRGSA